MGDLHPIGNEALGSKELISTPHCFGMIEDPSAAQERTRLCVLRQRNLVNSEPATPLSTHILHGLAYTVGSALGSSPPTIEECLIAFTMPNNAGLSAGARAWSKHFHRSKPRNLEEKETEGESIRSGWWGTPSGPVDIINEKALQLFRRIMDNATWRNVHWLPHRVLVYEARVAEGYGMRWSQDHGCGEAGGENVQKPWLLRGFVEPMIDNGHEVGWKH